MTLQVTVDLFQQSQITRPYPAGVVEPPQQIVGTSFFPGGHGVWESETSLAQFPLGGIMVLGHDFHNEAGYLAAMAKWRENLNGSTWRPLISLFAAAGVSLPKCFFTNFYMGLRIGSTVTGPFPGSKDLDFVSRCRLFLLHQMGLQKPRLVLVLGNHVPKLISSLSTELKPWDKLADFKSRDVAKVSLIEDVHFHVIQPFPCTVVSLVHPSMRHSNIKYRRWTNPQGQRHEGHTAEVEMVKYALSTMPDLTQ